MLKHLVFIIIYGGLLSLTGCASQPASTYKETTHQPVQQSQPVVVKLQPVTTAEKQSTGLVGQASSRLSALASTVLERGFGLLGTPYRWGGNTIRSGFDCSGLIGFLFREEAGIQLPRTTREMIKVDAPEVARQDLQPGDLIFFHREGHGPVNHVGIYIGDDRFLHTASKRTGGVRVDSLNNRYWKGRYLQAKRVLVSDSEA